MPLPANVTTVTVLGTFLTPEGDPSTGTVSFTPSSWLLNSGANVAIPNSTVTKALGTAGNFSVTLPITDDPDLSPDNWVYSVSEVVDGVSQTYNVLIPGTVAAGGTVYLADLTPAAPAGPEYYSLASSLSIGTVTTIAPGGTATASITGLAPSQVLNLGLVRGDTGALTTSGSGSVGTAAVSPTGDPNTGIYYPAADQVAITTGGTQALLLAAGAVSNPTFTGVATFPAGTATAPSITTSGDTNTGVHFPAADTVAIATGGSERLRVNSSGNVGIGTTSPAQALHIERDGAAIQQTIRNSTDVNPAHFYGIKRRGTSASRTTVSSGDELFRFSAWGYDGTNDVNSGQFAFFADTTVSTGVVPGQLRVTLANGAGVVTERFRLDSNGLITGTGTSLGAWTSYTPTLTGTGWDIGNGTAVGFYCRIGKIAFFRGAVTFGSTSTFGAVVPSISVPVTAAGADPHLQGATLRATYTDTSTGNLYEGFPYLNATGSFRPLVKGTNGLAASVTDTAPFTWATTDVIRFSGVYEIA